MYKTLLIASLFCLTGNSYGQTSNTGTPSYEDTYDEGKDKYSWHPQSEFSIPAGTIGIAGAWETAAF